MTDIPFDRGQQRRDNPPTKCTCPLCGYETERTPAVPCWSMKCPRCDMPLTGKYGGS